MAKIRKAIIGGIIAAAAALTTAAQSNGVTFAEWVTVIVSGLVAGYAVWQVPNATNSITTKH